MVEQQRAPQIVNCKKIHHTNQCGLSLIEVLIAVAVLAIGLLGLSFLQAMGLRNNTSAEHRTQAIYLAYDILDRIRANQTANYAIALNATPANATNCSAANANCAPQTMADYDLSQWKCTLGKYNQQAVCLGYGLQGFLPEGNGKVERNGTIYTVTIQWLDDQSGTPVAFTMSSAI